MKKKLLGIFLAALLILGAITPSAFAREEGGGQSEPSTLNANAITATMTKDLKDTTDLFNSTDPVSFNNQYLKIHINHPVTEFGTVKEGTKLVVELKPETGENLLRYPYSFSENKSIVADSGEKLADTEILTFPAKATLTFKALDKDFTIDLNSALEVSSQSIFRYFENHPSATELTQTYWLYINDQKQEKKITFLFQKPKPGEAVVKFSKTTGSYEKDGKSGEESMFYNIKIGTKLKKTNEFFIYDTPDVNLSFDDVNFRALFTIGNGKLYGSPFFKAKNGATSKDDTTGMECTLYEIYFLTEEPSQPSMPRQASYEEKTLRIDRENVITGENGFDALEKAAVPKNILVEKKFGEPLTPEEQQKIENAGGLNKKVGKGFKFHIKNFNHPLYETGGSFSLLYNMTIKHPSSSLNSNKEPVYYNTGSYYAQEIPTCDPKKDKACDPIKSEKTKLEDVARGTYTTEAILKEGQISGTVNDYSLVNFTKQDDKGKALKGATFTIYTSNAEGTLGAVAVNKDKVALEKLVTNDQGKLCTVNDDKTLSEVNLTLKRGYYVISEVQAPEGYEKAENHFFTVGFKVDPIVITNKSNQPTPETIDVKVSKVWDDNRNEKKQRPDSITVKLLEGGKDTRKTLVLNENNNWEDKFTGLDKTKTYAVEEVNVKGYESKITGDQTNGFVLTNKLKTQDPIDPNPDKPVTPTPNPDKPVNPTPNPDKPVTPTPNPDKPVIPTPNPNKPVTPTPTPDKPVTPTPNPSKPITPTPAKSDKPTSPRTEHKNPKTGDSTSMIIALSLAVLSVASWIVLYKGSAKKESEI